MELRSFSKSKWRSNALCEEDHIHQGSVETTRNTSWREMFYTHYPGRSEHDRARVESGGATRVRRSFLCDLRRAIPFEATHREDVLALLQFTIADIASGLRVLRRTDI